MVNKHGETESVNESCFFCYSEQYRQSNSPANLVGNSKQSHRSFAEKGLSSDRSGSYFWAVCEVGTMAFVWEGIRPFTSISSFVSITLMAYGSRRGDCLPPYFDHLVSSWKEEGWRSARTIYGFYSSPRVTLYDFS